MEVGEALPDAEEAVRFEDLTVDDDLPVLDRIVRYSRSQIALQRLVHVKMLGETSELAGMQETQEVVVPLLTALVSDAESIIRQHLAGQLLTVSLVCMLDPSNKEPESSLEGDNTLLRDRIQTKKWIEHPEWPKTYDPTGYRIVTQVIIGNLLSKLIADVDVDVRRATADCLTGLALQINVDDIATLILPIPLRLAGNPKLNTATAQNAASNKKTEAEQQAEEWRMTAANLLAELGGAVAEHQHIQATATAWGSAQLVPAILEFTRDPSFRVRRAAAQALPRILGAASVDIVVDMILPAFELLSKDELYRVRKSTGECLVDMSRSLVILATMVPAKEQKKRLLEGRRNVLIPIADRLIQDEHKMVRQGMMQFLGPFMASFYPFFNSALDAALPATSESDGSNHMGIVAQFFPHATSMVSRLNSSQAAVTSAPTPVLVDPILQDSRLEIERLQRALPIFLQASRRSAYALRAVRMHRQEQAPPHKDLEAIVNGLLDYFAALAIVQTGDENTDAEMRVYCAYSFPAVVLLLGPENWPGALKTCFFTLLNPSYAEDEEDANRPSVDKTEPPLPVKRCLASSLHTVAHVLGPDIATSDILPVLQDYFLRDPDEAVRLNIIRGFPTFLSILPVQKRADVFVAWSKVMNGEDCLGAKKRSATNPLVLNWRQRNYLARSLPDLVPLLSPELLHAHVWPICQQLLLDGVSLVRDDALWTIPVLLKVYTPENQQKWPQQSKKFNSKAATLEIVQWFKENVLKLGNGNHNQNSNNTGVPYRKSSSLSPPNVANFADRQLFCRLCGTIALSLRLNEEIRNTPKKDLANVLGETMVGLFFGGNASHPSTNNSNTTTNDPEEAMENMPYLKLSSAEHKHLKKILEEHLLSLALTMKDDRIRNVRVTLLKVLEILPEDMCESATVRSVLQTLQEEVVTWESFGDEAETMPIAPDGAPPQSRKSSGSHSKVDNNNKHAPSTKRDRGSGPVDVDEVVMPEGGWTEGDEAGEEVLTGDGEEIEDSLDSKSKKPSDNAARKDINKKTTTSKDESHSGEGEDSEDDDDGKIDEDEDNRKRDVAKPVTDLQSTLNSDAAELDSLVMANNIEGKESTEKALDELHDRSSESDLKHERNDAAPSLTDDENSKLSQKHVKRSKNSKSQPGRSSKMSGSKTELESTTNKSGKLSGSKTDVKTPPKKNKKEPASKRPTTVEEVVQVPPASTTPHQVGSVPEPEPQQAESENLPGWKTVIFDDGPIGLQLEPTADDKACRVYGFLETGSARKSGKIQLGDVIVRVNDVSVKSYDETVDLLKKGGRRAVTFRPGEATDDVVDEGERAGGGDSGGSDDDDDDDRAAKKKKKSSRKKSGPSASSSSKPAKPTRKTSKKKTGD